MSAPPPPTEEPVDNLEVIGDEEDEEDDDEDDFVPGCDVEDDDDDSDDDDASSTVVPLLDGSLFYGAKHALHYQGEGFHLAASEPAPWNILDSKVKPTANEFHLIMTGPCDVETTGAKATPRKIKVTFTVLAGPPAELNGGSRNNSNNSNNNNNNKKHKLPPSLSTGVTPLNSQHHLAIKNNHEQDHGKDEKKSSAQDSKSPGVYYRVFGSQIESNGCDLMEFLGGFHPPSTMEETAGLVCQVRIIASDAPATACTLKPVAVAAVAAAAARIDEEDEEDAMYGDEENADEDVDYNELIALHEDAGMSVDDLSKRYRNDDGSEGGGTRRRSTRSSSATKRLKSSTPPPDDDDCDGF